MNVQQAPAVVEMMAWEARAITALWPAAAAFARREPREAVARDVGAFREHPAGAYMPALFRTERRGCRKAPVRAAEAAIGARSPAFARTL